MSTLSSQIANLSPEQLARLAYELKAIKASKAQEILKRLPGDHCPLSFAQQRLWFIAQLQPDDPSYNCVEALRMTGKLNVALLHQTLNEVVRRHGALRTTFEVVAGKPVQVVSSEIDLSPSVIDLRTLPASEREKQLAKLSSEEPRRPFDLRRGPILRVVVLQLSEQDHAILVTTHQLISDGRSMEVLVREIVDLYLAFAEGRPSPLAELPFQYADFAIWQRQRFTGPVLAGHLDYWKQHLANAPEVLALPTDYPRPAVFTQRGSYEALRLSSELSHSLRELGHRRHVTLFMTMLGAFGVLLSRYSGQTDILIGSDIANRNQGTTESLIGFFVNQLALRVDLAGDPTFDELLERVKEVTLNGYAHQEAPFEKVVEMLNPERNLNDAPLFQVKLVLQNAATDNLELPELAISRVEAENPVAKFDLTLVISEGDRIGTEIVYSTDLFEPRTIKRMLTQFERLLTSAVRDPEQHISQLELLSNAERHQLLVERNETSQVSPPLRPAVRKDILPVSRQRKLPLSHAQQRLWFLDQMERGSATYNMPTAMRLKGLLDVEALERTLSEVVRRHEVLRTRFEAVNGQPVQVILPASQLLMPVLDLSALPEEQREAEARLLTQAEAVQSFDLSVGPLLRVRVLRLAADDHVVLLTMHHIISDGWSTGILVREVAALYEAYIEGRESPLPDLEIQYADYAVWQREWLQGDVLEQQLSYWRQRLGGELPVVQLRTDKPRPPLQSYGGRSVYLTVPAELTAQLKKLSTAEGVTLYMTLLATFKILMWRYSGQSDVVVGTPIAGRNHLAAEALIGLFVNTLVLRTSLSGDPSFRELLARVRAVTLGAYAHQDLPFEKLVEELQPERDMSRSPLFQVMFTLQNATAERLLLPKLESFDAGVDDETAKFDLTLGVTEMEGELNCSLQYNTALFEEATIRRMLRHYEQLLRSVVRGPQQRVSRLELLSDEERRQLLCDWNETKVDYETAVTISQLFERQVARDAAAIAVVSGDKEVTYGELNERANRVARHLRKLGAEADWRVGLLADRGLEMVVGLLGIVKAGAAYVPLDPGYPRARLEYMIADAAVSVLLTERRQQSLAMEVAADVGTSLYLDDPWAETGNGANLNATVDADNLAYVIYTSGSTGQPKGVMISQGAISNHMLWMQERFPLRTTDAVLQKTPFSFDASVWEFYAPLLAGARLVLARPGGHQDARYLVEVMEREGVTRLQGVPTLLRLLVNEGGLERCPQLREVFSGGEVLRRELAESLLRAHSELKLYNLYGPTEATIDATWQEAERERVSAGEEVGIGQPVANLQVYVLDTELRVVPVGVVGELYIGGAGLARGYLNRVELTADKFVPHPYSEEPGARLYRTGDMVRWREGRELAYVGRIDAQVKLRGFRIELGEIEAVLNQHASVKEAILVMQEIGASEQWLVAYVQLIKGAQTRVSELRAYLKERLPDYMAATRFVLLAEFPLTSSGKIDRRNLPVPKSVETEAKYDGPRTPTEELLTNLWASVLRVDRAGVNDNFFELGGHSLLAIQLISRIRETFGKQVAVRDVFESPTPAAFAEVVDKAMRDTRQTSIPKLSRRSRDMDLPLSYDQRRLWLLEQIEAVGNRYNIPGGLRFRGPLNIPALEQTLVEIIRRHEALRSNFVVRNGQPRQVIADAGSVALPIVDLSALDESERIVVVEKLGIEEARRPFDLARSQLLRVCLFRLSEEDHIGLFTMHHIVSDAWSMGVLSIELTTLYTAFSRGAASPLPELKIQYPDYAVWQQTYLAGEMLTEQLSYWKQQLAGAPALLNLPADRQRSPVLNYRGGQESLLLPAPILERVNELCRRENVTPFMVLLASFQLLLSWYSRQDDIVVGAPIAGRDQIETEPMVGFFVNTLVLRTKLNGNPDFREVLRRVRETALGAYAHQDVPFEMLVETLAPERNTAHTPLFQVVVGLQNIPLASETNGDLAFEAFERPVETTRYDLELTIVQIAQGMLTTLTYNAGLFEVTTIRRMLNVWQALLDHLLAHSDADVSAIFDQLDELDRQQRLSAEVEFRENTRRQLQNVKRRVLTQSR